MNRLRGNASLYLPVVSHLSDPPEPTGRTLTWEDPHLEISGQWGQRTCISAMFLGDSTAGH